MCAHHNGIRLELADFLQNDFRYRFTCGDHILTFDPLFLKLFLLPTQIIGCFLPFGFFQAGNQFSEGTVVALGEQVGCVGDAEQGDLAVEMMSKLHRGRDRLLGQF